jgi:phenylalanyl-tRNA synthetase beta chain
MIVSRKWISEFVNLDGIDNEAIAEQLTRAACEVEAIELKNRALEYVLIARVLSMQSHPSSSKLHLVQIDLGSSQPTVVCGAPNVQVGTLVAYAPVGTTFDNGMILTSKEISGVISDGMLCSAMELGVSDNHLGLWLLDGYFDHNHSAKLGENLALQLGLYSDVLFHVDNKSITNRGDLWGVLGMAREVAAILNRDFNNPYTQGWQDALKAKLPTTAAKTFSIQIDTPQALSYALLSLDNVQTSDASPLWMQYRLYLMGSRSIDLLVDISNYVMIELGIPNHIYDREHLAGDSLSVHELEQASRFTTLDGVERELSAGDIVISDASAIQIVAGVMGGKASMVSSSTRNIVMEAAVWQAGAVRKTSLNLRLRTDSSSRYEKSLDPLAIELTLLRLADLVHTFIPHAQHSAPLQLAKLPQLESKPIYLQTQWVKQRLGLELSYPQMQINLERLGYQVSTENDALRVVAPSFRATKGDLIAEDVLEEIIRIYGYDKLIPQAPVWPAMPNKLAHRVQLERNIQDFFVLQAGASEVFTHPLVGVDILNQAKWEQLNDDLKMLNSTNVEHDRVRPSLVPSLLKALELNSRHTDNFKIFELGKVQHPDADTFSVEQTQLGVIFYHNKRSPFMTLLDTTLALLRYLGVQGSIYADTIAELQFGKGASALLDSNWLGLHPHEIAGLAVNDVACGVLTGIHPLMMKEYKVRGHASLLILDLATLLQEPARRSFRYQSLSKYPSSRFDSTWILQPEDKIEALMQLVQQSSLVHLQDVYIFDIYLPTQSSERHITIRGLFGSHDATLDAAQVKLAEDSLLALLRTAGYQLKQ